MCVGAGLYRQGVTTESGKGLVLVVEDEQPIADVLRMYLTREGFGVRAVRTGEDAMSEVTKVRPVAILLDVGLPGISGIEVCRQLRAADDWTPILFLTARDEEVDRILGLEIGADDYINKPFSPREVVVRVRTILRRVRSTEKVLRVGAVVLEIERRQVCVADHQVSLTATEFDLLMHLMRRPGRIYSRDELLSAVWGYDAVGGTRTIDVHIAQVRAKLGEASPIRTVRGVGYGVE